MGLIKTRKKKKISYNFIFECPVCHNDGLMLTKENPHTRCNCFEWSLIIYEDGSIKIAGASYE